MLAEADQSSNSRRSTHKSTSGSDPEIPAIQQSGPTGEAELPSIEDVVDEFYAKYPRKARTFLVDDAGDDPREAYRTEIKTVSLPYESAARFWRTIGREPPDPWTEVETRPVGLTLREEVTEVLDGGDRMAITWGGALRVFLEWLDDREGTRGRFEHPDGSTFEKELLNSYDAEYYKKYYARLMGLSRELVGGERPTGEWTAGGYDNPTTALLALTSSGTDDRGDPRAPVDHLLERREAWGPTYKAMYDRMEELKDEGRIRAWEYLVVDEHHAGGRDGLNAGLGHSHPLIIADVVEGEELRAVDLTGVVEAWVENCPGAGWEAHDQRHPEREKRPIQVKRNDASDFGDPAVMNSITGYVTKYLYSADKSSPTAADAHPRERSVEQLAHQSVKWATNTRRLRKSDGAGEAIRADRCRQAHDRGDQELGHGEQLAHRSKGRGPEIVCAGCGSSWGVHGDVHAETVVEARRAADVDENPGVTSGESQDGGSSLIKGPDDDRVVEVDGASDGPSGGAVARSVYRCNDCGGTHAVADRDPDAESWPRCPAGDVGRLESVIESLEGPPPATGWELEAIIVQDDDAEGGERELRPSPGSGVEMVPVRGVEQVLETQYHQGNEGLADFLEHRRERDRRGERPPEPELPEPGGWDRPLPGPGRGGSKYAVLEEPTQADRRSMLRRVVQSLEGVGGAERAAVVDELQERGVARPKAEHAIDRMLERGELYAVASDRVRLT